MTRAAGIKQAERPTPMMAQYHEIKRAHPECLLFYRMGDTLAGEPGRSQ